jgi:putative intracellular protease/amidase
MVNISKRDLAVIAGLAGAADFLAEGRFTAPLARALKTVIRRGGPTAARFTGATALRAAGTVASVGKTIAMRHPVLTTGAVIYYTYKNREELGDLIEQGYEILQPKVPGIQQTLMDTFDRTPMGVGVEVGRRLVKKTKSKFNKMVSAGMKTVKASTSYGKKGTINNAKKAFSLVTKAASAVTKDHKLPKSGIKRKIMTAMRKLR